MQVRIGPTASPQGVAAADRRRRQADVQGDRGAERREPRPVPVRAPTDHRAGARPWAVFPFSPSWSWPTSTPACSTSSRSAPSACNGVIIAAGPPTRNTPSSARCGRRRNGRLRDCDGLRSGGVLVAAGSLTWARLSVASRAGCCTVLAAAAAAVHDLFISGVAETNPRAVDVSEGESEIVAGFHVEYGGMRSPCSSSASTRT